MLRPNIVLRCRLLSTYIIIKIIIKKRWAQNIFRNNCECFLEPNQCSLMVLYEVASHVK